MGSQRGTPMKSLSPKQRQALEAILRSLRQRGMPPILDEIAEAIGVKSRFGAFRHLRVPLSGESV